MINPPFTNEEDDISPFRIARFDEALRLPPADLELLQESARAIRQEHRDSSKWKRLSCSRVSVVAESDRGIVHVVHVDGVIDFDWTWEGATAFRPKSEVGLFQQGHLELDPESEQESALWSGEVLEVDEQAGCLFIGLDNPEVTPVVGDFVVRPFEFLAALNSIYHDDRFALAREELPRRLAATCGDIHPAVAKPSSASLDFLHSWWQHTWGILWGPPGTGKTYTTGQQVAAAVSDQQERILVVSTTNQATDSVAISIGRALNRHEESLKGCSAEQVSVRRIGKGASWQNYRAESLESLLEGTESDLLTRIDQLNRRLSMAESGQDRAVLRMQIRELQEACSDRSKTIFCDAEVQVVVATAFKAMTLLRDETLASIVNESQAPFTTMFLDEAGLLSRASVAALSLLASDRVVLVGDSKQLAPISRIARVLPSRQAKWIASSGISHLDEIESTPTAVHVLTEQYRMHQDVSRIVSDFQYGGRLTTAEAVEKREGMVPDLLAKFSRSVWYLLDEEDVRLDEIRSQRGPGNRSWIRTATMKVLQKLFDDDGFKATSGLFMAPFKAQSVAVNELFVRWKAVSWVASTVHSQQGSESDVVIFDTVNAGNVTWPVEEWKRLVNVAISRAREAVIVIATRDEMEEPFLRPLLGVLDAAVLRREENGFEWEVVESHAPSRSNAVIRESNSSYEPSARHSSHLPQSSKTVANNRDAPLDWKPKHSLGEQFASRRQMRPILSQEQQRLTDLDLDGKPRLVRGVAGSGKSFVLSNWVARTAEKIGNSLGKDFRIWAVYANRSLHKLLQDSIEKAWAARQEGQLFEKREFPWKNVSLLHAKDILEAILPEVGLSIRDFQFSYDVAAEMFLERLGSQEIDTRCNALFIDEAQDMGPEMLRLLLTLVSQTVSNQNHRSAHIFYDNAQNIYGVGTPKWSDYGLDMRGRSTIMKESFRSTRPIIEFAVNVLDHLSETEEHLELLELGLLKEVERGDNSWLEVNFNQVEGPKPLFQAHQDVDSQLAAMGDHLLHLLAAENVEPSDVCILYNGKHVAQRILEVIGERLEPLDVELSNQTSQSFQRRNNTILVTTPNSFKGYESEVVLIPCADQFVGSGFSILSHSLYVAMTRARSILAVYSQDIHSGRGRNGFGFGKSHRQISEVLQCCSDILNKENEG